MGKRLSFTTRAFGSDGVRPDISLLAEWISRHRGREGDITSFLLEQEILHQKEAGVNIPCAGGRFSFERWENFLTGIENGRITGELGYDAPNLVKEAEHVTSLVKGAWMTIPAPHLLNLRTDLSVDPDGATSALSDVYHDMMRSGRDAHLAGHVLFCEQAHEEELESFSGRKVFFFSPAMNKKTLSQLLEYQQSIALDPAMLPVLEELMAEYDVSRVILLDPGEGDLREALSIRDPDQIVVGGYCTGQCEEYWKKVVKRSSLTEIQRDQRTF
ncbi:MAG: hypothetical protein HGA55_02585 [Methanoregulaceae archaeon]|nr:hypothetical protein [Methanoregulaceae archaeon]